MSDTFDPIPLNASQQDLSGFIDDGGTIKFMNDQLSSFNFDGLLPRETSFLFVNELEIGMKFIPDESEGSLYQIIDIYKDDPELTEDPSPLHTILYQDENGETQEATFDESDQVIAYYEEWSEKFLGNSGWLITSQGNAIFSNIAARGLIEAREGDIGGWQITPIQDLFDGSLSYNSSVPLGESGGGAYLTGIYTGFGVHTDNWEEDELEGLHQPSRIFMIYGPGLDPDDPENLTPYWGDPKTTFYADGHGRFSLGDQLLFDANTGDLSIIGNIEASTLSVGGEDGITYDGSIVTIGTDVDILGGLTIGDFEEYLDENGYLTDEDLDEYVTDEDLITTGGTFINGNNITTGVINANLVNVSSGLTGNRGIKINSLGLFAYNSSGQQTFNINSQTGTITITGYATTSQLSNYTPTASVNAYVTSISGDAITSGTITGRTFRTASFGKRIELQTSGLNNGEILFYNESGIARGSILGAGNVLVLKGGDIEVQGNLSVFGFSNQFRNDGPNRFGLTPGGQAGLRVDSLGSTFSFGIQSNITGDVANVRIQNLSPAQLLRSTSTVRYKTELSPLDDNLLGVEENKISDLPPSVDPYDALLLTPTEFKGLSDADEGQRYFGFIAEDVAVKFPWACDWDEDGIPDAVKDRPILAAAISILKDQQKIIEDLQNRVLQLETQLGG